MLNFSIIDTESRKSHGPLRNRKRRRIMKLVPVVRTLLVMLLAINPAPILAADNMVELPLLAAVRNNGLGVFEVMMMWWDQKPAPDPIQLQWIIGGVKYGKSRLGSMAEAFDYAVDRTPSIRHTGTVSVQGVTYQPTGSDGPSAGAAMAVGFIAMFKGDRVHRGTALTGTIEPDGHIGWVGSIPDKIHAAKREGYHTVLVPRGQIRTPQWNLVELGFQLNIAVKEVDTIDEAYELMTGKPI